MFALWPFGLFGKRVLMTNRNPTAQHPARAKVEHLLDRKHSVNEIAEILGGEYDIAATTIRRIKREMCARPKMVVLVRT